MTHSVQLIIPAPNDIGLRRIMQDTDAPDNWYTANSAQGWKTGSSAACMQFPLKWIKAMATNLRINKLHSPPPQQPNEPKFSGSLPPYLVSFLKSGLTIPYLYSPPQE